MIRTRSRRHAAAIAGIAIAGLLTSGAPAHATGGSPTPVTVTVDGNAWELPAGAAPGAGTAFDQPTVDLTLITGDRVRVAIGQDGIPLVRETVAADRADGAPVAFHTLTGHGQRYLVPSDALGLLDAEVLDWELFNLGALARLANHGTADQVPVIVTHDPVATRSGASPAQTAAASLAGAAVEQRLESINATAMRVDGDGEWWRRLVAETGADPAPERLADARSLAGVAKIWLNGLSQLFLAESVPQVGAAAAWDLDYDGSGVTVAVLDTGIDPDHPDVAGKIVDAVNFTDSPLGWLDGHGHGTHVAATIAGSGDASDGLRPGVAPGADLLIGKVCNEGGSCPNDAIIAGMEWAAQSGAQVVNMSLGSGPTDGTDVLSLAVNQLSREYGTLFVISAGNDGPRASSVAAPSVADEALSVAAVDKSDQMADFSSRGPRVRDFGFKPEIAAPGVSIIAARGEGTAMGGVVDEFYTSASGTSMAAPHVAGAAALAAQQYPDLTGRQLKALLASAAVDLGHGPDAQGAGRLDVAQLVQQSVFGDRFASVARTAYPDLQRRELTYVNLTGEPVTLALTAEFTDAGGAAAPAGLWTLGAEELTVPAHGQATVELVLDTGVLPADGRFGLYTGVVEAADATGAVALTTGVRGVTEPERHQLVVNLTVPDGATDVAYSGLLILPVDDQDAVHSGAAGAVGREQVTRTLYAGAYSLQTVVRWRDADGVAHTAVPVVEVEVAGDTVADLDLREAVEARVEVGRQLETYHATLAFNRVSQTGAWQGSTSISAGYAGDEPRWWVLPTDPVGHGELEVASDYVLVPPAVSIRAIGGGSPITLDARYGTPDVSVPGPQFTWVTGEGDEARVWTQDTSLPVPRLTTSGTVELGYAGTGVESDLAGAELAGRLALFTPTDLCDPDCDFEALRPRVAAAAAAGAVGVLVAGEQGRVNLGVPDRGAFAVECDGPDDCPPVPPYAAVPVLSLPADQAAALIDRLDQRPTVRAQVGGDQEVSRVYALSFRSDGQVPELPYQVETGDLDRVEHRFHDRSVNEVGLDWQPVTAAALAAEEVPTLPVPRSATQRSLVMFLGGPADGDLIHRFHTSPRAFVAPMRAEPWSRPVGDFFRMSTMHIQELLPGQSAALSWQTGPTVPAAYQPLVTESGMSVAPGICAGCREGEALWPHVLLASSNGVVRNQLTGFANNTGVVPLILGTEPCEAPECTVSLFDQAGNQIEQQSIRVTFTVNASFGGGSSAEEMNR